MGPPTLRLQSAPAEDKEMTSRVFVALRVAAAPAQAFEAFSVSDHKWRAAVRHGCDAMEPQTGSGPSALAPGIVGTTISDGYLAEA
jgi:hypothetical protein